MSPDELEQAIRALVERCGALQTEVRRLQLQHNEIVLPLRSDLTEQGGRIGDVLAELGTLKRRQTRLAARVEDLLALKVGPPGLDGKRGAPGLDGKPGPPGENAATVIREVKISG